jgi:hypothetical protein
LIAVVEMSLSSWLVAGIVPGVERQPLKKLKVSDGGCRMRLPSGPPAIAMRPPVKEPRIVVRGG